MRQMPTLFRTSALLILCAVGSLGLAAGPRCAADALAQAEKLLTFHVGEDERIHIDDPVTELAPLRNPANRDQQFRVLEVWGYVYKGLYRMRFIYYESAGSCALMGQEILAYADL